MGFLSGLSKISDTFGGGTKSSSSSSSESGFRLLPQEIKNAFTGYASMLNNMAGNVGKTEDELRGQTMLRQGFAPTESSLRSDISMLMNPYMESVINKINDQANSDYSILKQNASQAGQFGSNRQMLGASDIENVRQSNIGSMLANQYNNALNTVFNNLIPTRQQDASNLMNLPYAAISKYGSLLGALPMDGGSISSSSMKSQTSQGLNGSGMTGLLSGGLGSLGSAQGASGVLGALGGIGGTMFGGPIGGTLGSMLGSSLGSLL